MDHPDLLDAWTRWSAHLQAPPLEVYPPKPVPPIPPEPQPSPYAKHKEYRMSTAKQTVRILCGFLYGRPNKPNTGPWGGLKDDAGNPRGWRGVIWDGVKDASGSIVSNDNKNTKTVSSDYEFELTMPDGRHSLYHAGADGFFGADNFGYAPTPGSDQFYIKPASETRGGYESPVIYDGNVTPKLLSGQVESVDDKTGQPGVSSAFSVEVLS